MNDKEATPNYYEIGRLTEWLQDYPFDLKVDRTALMHIAKYVSERIMEAAKASEETFRKLEAAFMDRIAKEDAEHVEQVENQYRWFKKQVDALTEERDALKAELDQLRALTCSFRATAATRAPSTPEDADE